jgi:hypothetical protein
VGDDRSIRYYEEAAVGNPCERFDCSLDIGGIVADLAWDEFDGKCGRRRLGKCQK